MHMWQEITELLEWAVGLGRGSHELHTGQMVLRGVLVYGIAVLAIRLGHKRFMARNSTIDLVLAIMLGSVFSRAITGQSPLVPTVAAAAGLVGVHWLLSAASFRSAALAELVKGHGRTLIKDGQLQQDQMRQAHINVSDLVEAVRLKAATEDLGTILLARVERNGEISVMRKEKNPQVIEVAVDAGVQKVRIELSA